MYNILRCTLLVVGVFGTNKCTVEESKVWIGQSSFTETMRHCAVESMGAYRPTLACLANKFQSSMTRECLGCFADSIKCGATHCKTQCVSDQGSRVCLDCIENKGCKSDLMKCTGFPEIAPDPLSKNTGSLSTKSKSANTMMYPCVWIVILFYYA